MSGLESGGEREPIEKPLTPEQAEVSKKLDEIEKLERNKTRLLELKDQIATNTGNKKEISLELRAMFGSKIHYNLPTPLPLTVEGDNIVIFGKVRGSYDSNEFIKLVIKPDFTIETDATFTPEQIKIVEDDGIEKIKRRHSDMLSKISSIRVKGSDPYGYTEGILKELRDRTKLEILADIDLDAQNGNIVIYTAYNKTIIKPDFTYEIKSLTDYDRAALKVISEQKRIIREAEPSNGLSRLGTYSSISPFAPAPTPLTAKQIEEEKTIKLEADKKELRSLRYEIDKINFNEPGRPNSLYNKYSPVISKLKELLPAISCPSNAILENKDGNLIIHYTRSYKSMRVLDENGGLMGGPTWTEEEKTLRYKITVKPDLTWTEAEIK